MTTSSCILVRCILPLAAAVLLAATTHAEQPAWKDHTGRPLPDTESLKSKRGFGGLLLATPDRDWKNKWQTPPETIPRFTTSGTVKKGGRLSVLIFFLNPGVDKNGYADVTADIQASRPDGSLMMNQKNLVCFRGKLQGAPYNVRLSAPVIEFVGEENDPVGRWEVRVTLKDNRRGVTLPLRTSFTLK